MIKQDELDKIRDNPMPEIRKRIRKALKGELKLLRYTVAGIIFDDFHTITGSINNKGNYILEFKISKKVC
ncbi:hypothetical protein LCGC14_1588350 [marine sediment metagenome]|uniref:Uncharacterized protein n=1 Tax=marine sediment metagenome TaxID=412755 RepID=A0A0F8VDD8_9ZZZZ